MGGGKSSFMEKYEGFLKSKNFKELCNVSLENKKGANLEDNSEEFKKNSKSFAKWLGQTYGVQTRK